MACPRAAVGQLQVVQEVPSLPGFGCVTEGLDTLKRPAQLAARFVVTSQLNKEIGQIAAGESFIPLVLQSCTNICRLPAKGRRILQPSNLTIKVAQFTQAESFAREVLLLHLNHQGLPVRLLGLLELPGVTMRHTNLMPDGGDAARLT